MKILISCFTYWPEKNGVQKVTEYLAEGLSNMNDVTVVTQSNDDREQDVIHNNVRIHEIDLTEKDAKKRYIHFIKQECADVFICVCTQIWNFDFLLNDIVSLQGKKILYTHEFSGLCDYPNEGHRGAGLLLRKIKYKCKWKLYYAKYKKVIKQFDIVTHLSITSVSYQWALENDMRNNVIIGNGAETIFFDHPVCQRESSHHIIKFVCVSNYDEIKNQKDIILAFYQSEIINSELILIGSCENSYYNQLKELNNQCAEKYGKRKVDLLTSMTRKEIADCLSDCDIYISMSRWEAFSVAILEAAAKGMPIITSDTGNARVIPGTLQVHNVYELSRMMEYLAKDEELRKKLGETARYFAVHYGRVDEKIEQLQKLLEE